MAKLNKKILIVEDDEDFSYILQKKFTMEGFLIATAKDGQEGILAAGKEKPDLILSDVLMPKVDGVEMTKKIHQMTPGIPIILLTNIKDIDYTLNVQKAGTFDYLIKSDTRLNEIVEKVKSKLGLT